MSHLSSACSRRIGAPDRQATAPLQLGEQQGLCSTRVATAAPYPTSANDSYVAVAVMMSSEGQLKRLAEMGNWPTWLASLISPTMTPVLFYPLGEPWFSAHHNRHWPATRLGLTACPASSADVVPGCSRWATPAGDAVLTCAVKLEVPLLYGGSLPKAREIRPASFCGRGLFNGEYVVANKWYAYGMFLQPVLGLFDFWAKIDVDVCWRRPLSQGVLLGRVLQRRALFWHAGNKPENPKCNSGLGEFSRLYDATRCGGAGGAPLWPVLGAAAPQEEPELPYGNFIGGWLGFWRSAAVLDFARQWHEWDSGWVHRWGDQQYWPAALWAARVPSTNDSAVVADLSSLRYSTFRHSKELYACGGAPPGTKHTEGATSAARNADNE